MKAKFLFAEMKAVTFLLLFGSFSQGKENPLTLSYCPFSERVNNYVCFTVFCGTVWYKRENSV